MKYILLVFSIPCLAMNSNEFIKENRSLNNLQHKLEQEKKQLEADEKASRERYGKNNNQFPSYYYFTQHKLLTSKEERLENAKKQLQEEYQAYQASSSSSDSDSSSDYY